MAHMAFDMMHVLRHVVRNASVVGPLKQLGSQVFEISLVDLDSLGVDSRLEQICLFSLTRLERVTTYALKLKTKN